MKKILKITSAALLASAFVAGPVYAQNENAMENSAKELAPGQLKIESGDQSATEFAPGQTLDDDAAESATDMTPGIDQETTASINLTEDQKSRLSTVFADVDRSPAGVDFQASIGATAPETIMLQPLPSEVAEIVPDYGDHQYFVSASGDIVIVAPDTREVVYVVDPAA